MLSIQTNENINFGFNVVEGQTYILGYCTTLSLIAELIDKRPDIIDADLFEHPVQRSILQLLSSEIEEIHALTLMIGEKRHAINRTRNW